MLILLIMAMLRPTPTEQYVPDQSPKQRLIMLHGALMNALSPAEQTYAESRANGTPSFVAARTAGVSQDKVEAFVKRAEEDPLVQQAIKLFGQAAQSMVENVTPDRINRLLARAENASENAIEMVAVANALMKLLSLVAPPDNGKNEKLINATRNISSASDEDLMRASHMEKVDSAQMVELKD